MIDRRLSASILVGMVMVVLAMSGRAHAQAQNPASPPNTPEFRTGVERLTVDVTVVDDRGRPVTDLRAPEFQVSVDGVPRRVQTAEWVPLASRARPFAVSALPEGFSSNQGGTGGRLIAIVVDQPSIRFGGGASLRTTIESFVDSLAPTDLVAAVGLGTGAPSTTFTTDHALVKRALANMPGQRQRAASGSRHGIDLGTALAVQRGTPGLIENIFQQKCSQEPSQIRRLSCESDVRMEVAQMAIPASQEGVITVQGLEQLMSSLASIDAPKTVIMFSEGFVTDGTQSDNLSHSMALGALAASARASLYVLHVDEPNLDLDRGSDASRPSQQSDDRRLRRESLEMLAASSRGGLFSLTGTATGVFDRLLNELSGYYLLGVESTEADRRGVRPLRVTVGRSGVTVRGRRVFGQLPAALSPTLSTRERLGAALNNPLPLSSLPLRVATFSLQGSELGKVQLLIRVDIGEGYTAPDNVTLVYVLMDGQGRALASQAFDGQVMPGVKDLPSPLAYTVGGSVPPGEYTLRLAALSGDTVGTITHPVHAVLTSTGTLLFSDLIAGGPIPTDPPLTPTVDSVVRFGAVHGYLEAYGPAASATLVRFEVVADDSAAALAATDIRGENRSDRTVFSALVPTHQLPPGRYRLRAVVNSRAGNTVLSREFDVETATRPAGRVTASAGGGANLPERAPLFLPVTASDLRLPFSPADALSAAMVESFTHDLPAAIAPQFAKGLAALKSKDFVDAERQFKEALQPDADATAALAYLGATFALAGHDSEAAGVWQTALVDGSDHAPLYAWAGSALLRSRDLPGALAMLEDGSRRWPDDASFAWPLAILYASLGRGREALPQLERHLAHGTPAPASLALGVEWLYRARMDGVVLHGWAEDLALARRYADAYARANGPQQPLIKQWLDYLSRP